MKARIPKGTVSVFSILSFFSGNFAVTGCCEVCPLHLKIKSYNDFRHLHITTFKILWISERMFAINTEGNYDNLRPINVPYSVLHISAISGSNHKMGAWFHKPATEAITATTFNRRGLASKWNTITQNISCKRTSEKISYCLTLVKNKSFSIKTIKMKVSIKARWFPLSPPYNRYETKQEHILFQFSLSAAIVAAQHAWVCVVAI